MQSISLAFGLMIWVLTAEDGESTVRFCDVVDQLLDQHRLTDTRTTEKSDLSTTRIGRQ